jgi:hypothetical protein
LRLHRCSNLEGRHRTRLKKRHRTHLKAYFEGGCGSHEKSFASFHCPNLDLSFSNKTPHIHSDHIFHILFVGSGPVQYAFYTPSISCS